ncbi:28956_t:CDS:2 [Gigaspora margarita]|uniref:28956_t:CDS:1 n=1 Tax=Gigaspora margarita TaxID=4874 RepID=A0ABN7UNJ9_GIGMA|nr:28956_t:CDS:2 [Gigaspora margarita]
MEIIQDDLYVYVVETSYVDTCFTDKKKDANENSPKEFTTDNQRVCEKLNMEETNSSVLHNMRKRAEMVKGANNNVDGREYKKTI